MVMRTGGELGFKVRGIPSNCEVEHQKDGEEHKNNLVCVCVCVCVCPQARVRNK